jgi:hypothetical protein
MLTPKFGQYIPTNLDRIKNLKLALICQEQEEPSERLQSQSCLEALKRRYHRLAKKVRAVAQSNFNVEVRSDTESFCSFLQKNGR